jgi:hypothetical protein
MPRGCRMTRSRAALLAAVVLTGANAAKPLVIDDTVYVAFARQALAHPADPYAFELYWYDAPEPAMGIGTVPPVLPYWLAGAMSLFGDSPVAWKLSLLPFALALTGSLVFLLGRFAPPFAMPVLFGLALGPAVLPGFNLMLDVPALALGLLGVALFVGCCERGRGGLALVAGVILGLAMQTKYAAVVYAGPVLVAAVLYRRPGAAAVALLAAAALFLGVEGCIAARHEHSHLLAGIERMRGIKAPSAALTDVPGVVRIALDWSASLLSLAGGTAPYATLLALVALGAGRRSVAGAALAVGLAFAAIPAFPLASPYEGDDPIARAVARRPEIFLFVTLGAAFAGCVGAAALGMLRRSPARDPRPDRLLAAWLLIEIVGFFAVSPYPAVRRVMGVGIAATLLAARAALRRAGEADARAGVSIATVFALGLGALYFGAEFADARARCNLVGQVAQRLHQIGAEDGNETVWYTGHWAFQFYAERAGMRAAVAGESRLRPDDWLVIPEGVPKPSLSFPADALHLEDRVVAKSASPWSTLPRYYSGPLPLRRQPEIQAAASIFRVERDVVPRREPASPEF